MAIAIGFAMALSGCSGLSPEWQALSRLSQEGFTNAGAAVIPAQPNPKFRYLRVEVDGHPPGLLVLGYVDAHPLGPIEVWYSGNQEVVKTQNGRIVGTGGLAQDWLAVRYPDAAATPPVNGQQASGNLQRAGDALRYVRSRDLRQGYRYGVLDHVQWVPASSPQGQMKEIDVTPGREPSQRLPDALFVLGKHLGEHTVVASYQCLAPDFCLRLTRWPVREDAY